jgi:hypothetical protein
MIRCMTLLLHANCRVRTSEGPAAFAVPVTEVKEIEVPNPHAKGKDPKVIVHSLEQTTLAPLGNDYGGSWVHLKPGTKITIAACYQKTDTWCLGIQEPAGDDGKVPPLKGMILRQLSFNNVLAASREIDANGQPVEASAPTTTATPETSSSSTSTDDQPGTNDGADTSAAAAETGDVDSKPEEAQSVDQPAATVAPESTLEELLGAEA